MSDMSLCASEDEGQGAGLWGHPSLLCTACGCEQGVSAEGLRWLNFSDPVNSQHLAQNISAAETSPAAAHKVGFGPIQGWAVGAVRGFGVLLSCQQVAVALTLLDFDRLGGESFRVLGKLPK